MAEVHRVALADGTSLYVEELGRGHAPTVIFGHSLLCDGRMFVDQVVDLARDHHVINVDFRGHGRSDAPRGPYTLADQADDLLRVMDALGVGSAVLVGLSMGGGTALQLALTAPDRARALVLLDTSADREAPVRRLRYTALAQAARAFGVRRWLARQSAAVLFGASFRRDHPDVVAVWEDRMMALDGGAVARAVQMVTSRPSLMRKLSAVTAPTLVIVGEEDTATPPAQARALADQIPNARFEVIAGAGHLSTVERPQETARLIRAFIDGLDDEGQAGRPGR